MQFGNVKSINYFKHADPPNGDNVMTMGNFASRYGFEPDGVNDYVGLSAAAQVALHDEGSIGLNATHKQFFASIVADAIASTQPRKQIVIGLEPAEVGNPFGFINANLAWVADIASDIAAYQAEAVRAGKRLDVYVRFASEMNDHGNATYGRRPTEYRPTFASVRNVFRDKAPAVKFSFSPALRADTIEEELSAYWPGDGLVDLFAGTWYAGSNADFAPASTVLEKYVLHRAGTGLPFAISEIGGVGSAGNDQMLEMMFQSLHSLAGTHGISFEYVTLFLDTKWGADATLKFISNPAAPG